VKLFDVPFKVAITEVVTAVVTAVVFIEKLAPVAPPATVIEAGIVIAGTGVPSFNATLAPRAGAGWFRVTVQVEDPNERTVAGVHVSAESPIGGLTGSEKLAEVPLRVAVMITLLSVGTAPTVTVKEPLIDPAGIVTDDGIVTVEEVAPNPKDTRDEVSAFADKVTVQVTVAGPVMVVGLHVSVPNRLACTTVNIAPIPAAAMLRA